MGVNKTEMLFVKKKSLKDIVNSVISTLTSENGIETYTLRPPKSATGREIDLTVEYDSVEDRINELGLTVYGNGEKNFITSEELHNLALMFGSSKKYFDMHITQEQPYLELRYERRTIANYLTARRASQFVSPRYPAILRLYGAHDNKFLFLRSTDKEEDHSWYLVLRETRPKLFANLRMKAINEYFEKYLAQDIPCSDWEISWTS